jgi:hypothetical protein
MLKYPCKARRGNSARPPEAGSGATRGRAEQAVARDEPGGAADSGRGEPCRPARVLLGKESGRSDHMPTDYEMRYAAALRAADEAGFRRGASETFLVRGLRGLGLRPRPPHYAGFAANVMMHGLPFTLVWGVLMWALVWGDRVPPAHAAVAALMAGLFFGVVVAYLYRATADRASLPRWEDLPGGGGAPR